MNQFYGKMDDYKKGGKNLFEKNPKGKWGKDPKFNKGGMAQAGNKLMNNGPSALSPSSQGYQQPYGNMPNVQGTQQQAQPEMHKKQMHDMCHKYHLYLVQVETIDGQLFEGIVDEYDEDGVTLIVPCGDMDDERVNGYGYGPGYDYGYGYGPGFGSPYGYGYPRRFRRFRRFRYPFFNLSRIFFPFFF